MEQKNLPYLIIGQGIAGTLVAWHLRKAGFNFFILDAGIEMSASNAAAGIINPVTGRRIVKSWMIDQLIPFARKCYHDIEKCYSIKILFEQNILRHLSSVREENVWLSKAQQDEYHSYISPEIIISNLNELLPESVRLGQIYQSMRVDLRLLLYTFRRKMLEEGTLLEEVLDYHQIQINENTVGYKGIDYQGIIFCEGWQCIKNPWFGNLPLALNKGESLTIEIPQVELDFMLKYQLFIVPEGNHQFWVGSNYEWEFEDPHPSQAIQHVILAKLKRVIKPSFNLISAKAGIRPSTSQRKPILGRHPEIKPFFILNGLGTKGSSLAPFWSNVLVNHIIHNTAIAPEVDVATFLN